MTTLTLTAVNSNVYSVYASSGLHIGNLKRISGTWKFKAVGYDASGAVEPGGGPYTDRHNTAFVAADAAAVSAALGCGQ